MIENGGVVSWSQPAASSRLNAKRAQEIQRQGPAAAGFSWRCHIAGCSAQECELRLQSRLLRRESWLGSHNRCANLRFGISDLAHFPAHRTPLLPSRHLPALAIARAGLPLAMGLPATAHALAGARLSTAAHGQEAATTCPVNDRDSTSPAGPRVEGIDIDQFAPPLERCVSKNPGQDQQHQDCPLIEALFSDHCPPAAASARALFSSRGLCSPKARRSTCELGLYSGTISFSCRMSCVTSRTAQICRSVSRGPVISP